MFRIDGHCHTLFSDDSHARIGRVVRWAARRNLAALVISDHDTMDGVDPVRREVDRTGARLLVIPGIEVTTDRRTHVLGLWLPRAPRSRRLLDVIAEIHDLGGVAALPHPYRRDTGLLANAEDDRRHTAAEVDSALAAIDLIEFSNAKSRIDELERLLARLPELPPVPLWAGSDAHVPHEIGRSTVHIDELSPDGLRRGGVVERREAVSADRAGSPCSSRRRLMATIPSRYKGPWRALKREVRYWIDARAEIARARDHDAQRWRRNPDTGLVEAVTEADTTAGVAVRSISDTTSHEAAA